MLKYVESRGELDEYALGYAFKANNDIAGIGDSRLEGNVIAFISGENNYQNRTLEFVDRAYRIRKVALNRIKNKKYN